MNMREKMARAMCLTWPLDPDEIGANDGPNWKRYLPMVDAILEAMKEPTPEMVSDDINVPESLMMAIWQAMIEAAKEG